MGYPGNGKNVKDRAQADVRRRTSEENLIAKAIYIRRKNDSREPKKKIREAERGWKKADKVQLNLIIR